MATWQWAIEPDTKPGTVCQEGGSSAMEIPCKTRVKTSRGRERKSRMAKMCSRQSQTTEAEHSSRHNASFSNHLPSKPSSFRLEYKANLSLVGEGTRTDWLWAAVATGGDEKIQSNSGSACLLHAYVYARMKENYIKSGLQTVLVFYLYNMNTCDNFNIMATFTANRNMFPHRYLSITRTRSLIRQLVNSDRRIKHWGVLQAGSGFYWNEHTTGSKLHNTEIKPRDTITLRWR